MDKPEGGPPSAASPVLPEQVTPLAVPSESVIAGTPINSPNTDPSETLSQPPRPWEKEWERNLPLLGSLSHKISEHQATTQPTLNILRVNQVDAAQLDDELTLILRSSLMKIFSFWQPSTIEQFQPELDAVLNFIMYRLSFYATSSTYGQKLQNLIYRDERADYSRGTHLATPPTLAQKLLWGLLHIGGRWGWARINRIAASRGWAERPPDDVYRQTWQLLNYLETIYKVFALFNFVFFLYDGKYGTLIDRLLGMRLVYNQKGVARYVDFEFMNRQLVWAGFTEFLMFITPLINVDKIKNSIARMFRSSILPRGGSAEADLAMCQICQSSEVLSQTPYETDCGHVYCYYCIKTAMMADKTYCCPRCGETVKRIKRFKINK